MTPGSNIIFPGSTDSSGANIPGSNINIVLVCNNGELKNLDASQLDLQKLLLGSAGVRGSYRQTKTRLKKKSSSSGIQADSSGLSESVAGLHDDDSDGPAFEVNESPIDDINDFKTLMNTIQNSGEDANIEVTEIKKSEDGEISISWKVSILCSENIHISYHHLIYLFTLSGSSEQNHGTQRQQLCNSYTQSCVRHSHVYFSHRWSDVHAIFYGDKAVKFNL